MALCNKSPCFQSTRCDFSGLPLAIHVMKNKTDVKDFASPDAESERKESLL